MKNIIWKNLQGQYIVTQIISDDVDSIAEKDKMIAKRDAEKLIFIDVDYSQDQINELCKYQNLEEAKTTKIAKLNTSRSDYCLEPILYNSNYYATTSNAQIAMLSYILTLGNNETLYPNSEGDNILLNKQDFLEIVSQIQEKEMSSRDLRESNIDKINKIELSKEAMETLNKIDITF
jgi:hypothetical protein